MIGKMHGILGGKAMIGKITARLGGKTMIGGMMQKKNRRWTVYEM